MRIEAAAVAQRRRPFDHVLFVGAKAVGQPEVERGDAERRAASACEREERRPGRLRRSAPRERAVALGSHDDAAYHRVRSRVKSARGAQLRELFKSIYANPIRGGPPGARRTGDAPGDWQRALRPMVSRRSEGGTGLWEVQQGVRSLRGTLRLATGDGYVRTLRRKARYGQMAFDLSGVQVELSIPFAT